MDAYVANPIGHAKELAVFSWWFASPLLPLEWTMPQLLRVLERGERIEGAHLILERLADVSSLVPLGAIRALDLLVIHDTAPGHFYGWHDSTRRIIATALSSDQPEVRDLAARVLNALAARGNREFDDLAASVAKPAQN